jgi:DNA repair photolyase
MVTVYNVSMALKTTRGDKGAPTKGRGAPSNIEGRFERWSREAADDGWAQESKPLPRLNTDVTREAAKSIISRNDSPDLPFDYSINPYRGCEHGCSYCYARPSHGYLGLSPGLDFETRLFAKVNAAELLQRELAAPDYVCKSIAIGANTDAYQPIEREFRITRSIIEVLAAAHHPFSVVTKNALIERDIDLMAPMAVQRLVRTFVTVTSLDPALARKLEPRAAAPYRRLEAVKRLADAGIPVGVMIAPIIPFLNDSHIEEILARAKEAGATEAGYVLLRLPYEVAPLFQEWLLTHFPLKARHVMSLVRQMRGGKDYVSTFGERQTGTGNFAALIAKRFDRACVQSGLSERYHEPLDTSRFRPPQRGPQMTLF